ncbi:MAG: shikimate kinase [Chitinophagales bacterium]
MSKIFLIGFMGSGKTTVGKQLASILHYDFIDLDEYIESKEQSTISNLFEVKGESYFREKESYYLKSLDAMERLVLSTGGGTPCFFDNMDWMNANGTTVYLKAVPKLLADRLKKEREHRPLLKGKSDTEVIDFIHDKLMEREIFYLSAKVIAEAVSLNGKKLHHELKTRNVIDDELPQ